MSTSSERLKIKMSVKTKRSTGPPTQSYLLINQSNKLLEYFKMFFLTFGDLDWNFTMKN